MSGTEAREHVERASDFVRHSLSREPGLLTDLAASGDLQRSSGGPEASAAYYASRAPRPELDEPDFMARLRGWRRREMVRIAWRDLAGWVTLEETLADLSAFADAAIGAAYRHAWAQLTARYGEPRSESGETQPLVVVAMGKLGGGELNFSSDIDLVFLFPEHGETAAQSSTARAISNAEFFTRLGQTLIRLLDARTADGFVFRVDMRLRPFGESGPLAASFASFEDYLQRHGRDWERYAWIKARPVTAPERYAELYASAIRPFVYRRYLDYGVFQSLREMKGLIEREVERRELADDVKLGPGGIREIEFVVQALQLIRGGRDIRLQTPSLLAALPLLDRNKLLPAGAAGELHAAYEFLRRLENRLQMLGDEQTHRLPKDPASRERIAAAMGAADWPALARERDRQRGIMTRHFRAVIFAGAADPRQEAPTLDLDGLRAAGFGADAPEAARLLAELLDSTLARKLDEAARRRLDALLPALVASIGAGREPLAVLKRVLRILEAIGPRSAYFALLNESAGARARLTELAADGDFLAAQIAAYPLLLDELVDERVLLHTPSRGELEEELRLALGQIPDDEPERQVEALRHFQQAAAFHVAVADLTGRLPVMRVSDRLTEIAELIVGCAMSLAWRQITAQYGVPMCGEEGARRPVAVCAVGYGKLGGVELGYASDLDLVFLHDSAGERQETDGSAPVDNAVFFVRLAQRILHLLTMHSSAGRLYEVDVRLRPSGKGGLLVTSVAAFEQYQEQEAWTWEHQALLHARAVAGAAPLMAEFERVRMSVLERHVRRGSLRDDVRAMRERMRRELSKARPGEFDIKQDAGGIADIEFLAQYWSLVWARDYPPVARYSDTIRQLESVASAALVPQATVDVLTAAYRAYRVRAHHLSLEERPAIVQEGELAAERAAVTAVWQATMTRE
jgi:glutamate-ammonia-ligase adenylyltransferase